MGSPSQGHLWDRQRPANGKHRCGRLGTAGAVCKPPRSHLNIRALKIKYTFLGGGSLLWSAWGGCLLTPPPPGTWCGFGFACGGGGGGGGLRGFRGWGLDGDRLGFKGAGATVQPMFYGLIQRS